jgi:hypothetical protein
MLREDLTIAQISSKYEKEPKLFRIGKSNF